MPYYEPTVWKPVYSPAEDAGVLIKFAGSPEAALARMDKYDNCPLVDSIPILSVNKWNHLKAVRAIIQASIR